MNIRIVRYYAAYLGVLLGLLVTFATGQQEPAATSAVRAGRLIDVRSGRVTTNTYIVIAKDRILRIADSVPAGIPIVDLSHYTVVPGLIDSHAHVLGNPRTSLPLPDCECLRRRRRCGECTVCRFGSTTGSPHCAMRARAI